MGEKKQNGYFASCYIRWNKVKALEIFENGHQIKNKTMTLIMTHFADWRRKVLQKCKSVYYAPLQNVGDYQTKKKFFAKVI